MTSLSDDNAGGIGNHLQTRVPPRTRGSKDLELPMLLGVTNSGHLNPGCVGTKLPSRKGPDAIVQNSACVRELAPADDATAPIIETLSTDTRYDVQPASSGIMLTTDSDPCLEQSTRRAGFTPQETIIIFDWDDTLLPSTWLKSHNLLRLDDDSCISEGQFEQLNEVAKTGAEILRQAKTCGTVVILTNAEHGWVEKSCQKFLPFMFPYLENVKIISARTTFESPTCETPAQWKLCAFFNELHRTFGPDELFCDTKRQNIISIGDGPHERDALLMSTASLPNCVSKFVKFIELPDVTEICKQQSLVMSLFDQLMHGDNSYDLCS